MNATTIHTAGSAKTRPQSTEYASYYGPYIDLAPDGDIVEILRTQSQEVTSFLRCVPQREADVLHPPYTWTLKQVVNHISDGERVFAYRALCIARSDKTPLPGFDENEYAKTSEVERLTLADLADEFETVRAATLSLLQSLPDESWTRTGTANEKPISVRALAWIMAGHTRHHLTIMKKRVGK
jgi:hypothetical protein